MATIPNAYYNSPWIADAARNLASALAPPDPQKQLATKMAQFEYDQALKKADLDEHDRSEKDLAEGFFSQIARFKPILKEDGTEDTEATERAVMDLYGQGIEHGGDISKGMALSGPYAPEFSAKQLLQQVKAQAAAAAITQRFGLMGDLQDRRFENEGVRDERRHGYAVDMADINYKNKLALEADRHLHRIAEKRAATAGGKPPRMVSDSTMQSIIYQFDLKEQATGKRMPAKYKDKLIEEAEDAVQSGGKIQTAVNSVWTARGLDDIPEAKKKVGFWDALTGGGESDDDLLIPKFDAAPTAAPAADPSSLGGAAIGAGAAPTSASAPAPGAVPTKRAKDGRMLPAPRSKAERDSLRDGEEYITPTGEVFTKRKTQ